MAGSDSEVVFIEIEQYTFPGNCSPAEGERGSGSERVSDEGGVAATRAEFATNAPLDGAEGM